MVFDQFDRDAMRLVMDAQAEARKLGGAIVGTEHLLLAGTMQSDVLQRSLERAGVDKAGLVAALGGSAGGMPSLDGLFAAKAKDELLPFAKDTERCFKASLFHSQEAGSGLVSSQDLILSLLADEEADTGALKVLRGMNLDASGAYKAVQEGERELVGAGGARSGKNSTLAQCSVDLTKKAEDGLLDPRWGATRR